MHRKDTFSLPMRMFVRLGTWVEVVRMWTTHIGAPLEVLVSGLYVRGREFLLVLYLGHTGHLLDWKKCGSAGTSQNM